jgi:hypothetical protein
MELPIPGNLPCARSRSSGHRRNFFPVADATAPTAGVRLHGANIINFDGCRKKPWSLFLFEKYF